MEQEAELYGDSCCTSKTTFSSRWTCIYGLKYAETSLCSGNNQKVSKAISESEDTVQTNKNGQLQ